MRFLGVDAPEVRLSLPGGHPDRFIPLTDSRWQQTLADPFAATLPSFTPPLDSSLQAHLAGRCGSGTAANHARLAKASPDALEDLASSAYF